MKPAESDFIKLGLRLGLTVIETMRDFTPGQFVDLINSATDKGGEQ